MEEKGGLWEFFFLWMRGAEDEFVAGVNGNRAGAEIHQQAIRRGKGGEGMVPPGVPRGG